MKAAAFLSQVDVIYVRPRRAKGRPSPSKHAYIINPETGCWIWQRSISHQGYGLAWNGEKMVAAHRAFYEAKFGPVPADKQLDHLCRNRRCVNPDHLEPVTAQENSRRGPSTKLSNVQVLMIEDARRVHIPAKVLASQFGVTTRQIHRIWQGKRSGSLPHASFNAIPRPLSRPLQEAQR